MRDQRSPADGERGAALLTVLMFLMLMLILMTSMLALTGNELLISRIQRDGMQAFALTQSGLVEAIHRMQEGHPYLQGFPAWSETNGSDPPNVDISIIRKSVGVTTAYVEIRADAMVGLATRRVSMVVLQRNANFPPNAVVAGGIVQQEAAVITCGDVYSRSFVQYRIDPNSVPTRCPNEPAQPASLTYAAWRVSSCLDPNGACSDGVPPCYRTPCPAHAGADTSKWYPATRMAEPADSPLGQELAALITSCAAGGGGSLPNATITGRLASEQDVTDAPQYGFDVDDPDDEGPAPPQAVIPGVLPCGLPYKYELLTFAAEDGRMVQRYVKRIPWEHWWPLYWRFDERLMRYIKRAAVPCRDAYCLSGGVEPDLAGYPGLGAIPPLPPPDTVTANFDCWKGGGGTLRGPSLSCDRPAGRISGLGCKSPQMVCSPPEDRPISLALEGSWMASDVRGHGTLVVKGDLVVTGPFDYWGMVIVTGPLALGTSDVTIHGGVVSFGVLRLGGDVSIEGGGTVPSIPTGRSIVSLRGWWER